MTLDKAIELGKWHLDHTFTSRATDSYNSLKLLIEAGEREIDYRLTAPIMNIVLLPGETQD